MASSSRFKDLQDFLIKHSAKNEKNKSIVTHTRIGDSEANIYGGSYIIPKEEINTFHKLYYDNVFVKKKMEYLTEKQLDIGPILVDFDFRYNYDVETRQHTIDDINEMIFLYLDALKEFFIFDEKTSFDLFILEKPSVNRLEDKSITKDGIHMIITIQMDRLMQVMLREKLLVEIENTWSNLPLTNSWDSVIDETISKGTTNWQLYGSRKPGHEAYELTQHYFITYDKSDGEFRMKEMEITAFDFKKDFVKLTAQNSNCVKFEINPKIIDEYNRRLESKNNKPKKQSGTKVELLIKDEDEDEDEIILNDIKNKEMLKKAVDQFLKKLLPSEHEIRETHEYTQILPEKYYQPGSHLLNRQVAFALKHTDDRLFLSWVMLRSKASDFDYNTIPDLYQQWKRYFHKKEDGVTKRSIMYWAKQDAYEDYIRVKNASIENFIEETLNTQTDFDFALVLHQMFKDKYVCNSITNKTWHVFRNHRWEPDKGLSLRLAISKDMHNMYKKKLESYTNEMQQYNPSDEICEHIKRKSKAVCEICVKLKKTNDKNNIMREAMELFYDKEFIKKMDSNKYLMCFNNGVIDFKNKIFRDGYPQDYITKTCGIDYVPYDINKNGTIIEELLSFMEKLFPVPSLNHYMWDHLASCLIGTNMNQTFNIYRGSGSNGKSILTDLMSQALGEYKGTVPITLVTEKRNGIGGTSSEVIQLKGIRYAVMQEPSKDTKINEGIMKELTGGDPVQGRALYCESEIFEPQFKLVVCTNTLFEINSNDDGTWRRIRICDFMSKFIDDNEVHTDDTKYVFQKDKSLKERLPILAPVFMSMLVKRAFETEGVVEDSDIVLSASNKYRQGQDHISAFINEMIMKTNNPDDKVKQRELNNQFKIWYQDSQGGKNMPKGSELYEYMDKKFGKCKSNVWSGIKILYPENSDDIMDDLKI
jgi:P4 family phage/plasmid primase-like protien